MPEEIEEDSEAAAKASGAAGELIARMDAAAEALVAAVEAAGPETTPAALRELPVSISCDR